MNHEIAYELWLPVFVCAGIFPTENTLNGNTQNIQSIERLSSLMKQRFLWADVGAFILAASMLCLAEGALAVTWWREYDRAKVRDGSSTGHRGVGTKCVLISINRMQIVNNLSVCRSWKCDVTSHLEQTGMILTDKTLEATPAANFFFMTEHWAS